MIYQTNKLLFFIFKKTHSKLNLFIIWIKVLLLKKTEEAARQLESTKLQTTGGWVKRNFFFNKLYLIFSCHCLNEKKQNGKETSIFTRYFENHVALICFILILLYIYYFLPARYINIPAVYLWAATCQPPNAFSTIFLFQTIFCFSVSFSLFVNKK